MASEFVIDLLRKWRAGKKLTKNQYTELVNDGYLIELAEDTYVLSKHGNLVLNKKGAP